MSQIEKFFNTGPFGISSSCLTSGIKPLQNLLTPLKCHSAKHLLGWITLKSIDEVSAKKAKGTRIVHFEGSRFSSSILPFSLMCRGRNEEEKTVPAWYKMKYLLKYGARKFKVLVEHEGSGMDFDLEGSRGGYVHLTVSGW